VLVQERNALRHSGDALAERRRVGSRPTVAAVGTVSARFERIGTAVADEVVVAVVAEKHVVAGVSGRPAFDR
jgi:hypothetical protein